MRAVVVALGKIGLPLAVQVARAGHEVVGCDVNPVVVDAVNAARAPFPGEAGLEEALAEVVGAGRLRAQTDTRAAVAEGPELVLAVPPLVVDTAATPDWGVLDAVVADIGAGLRPGTTVSIETTVPVGTTRERIAPALAAASGLVAEKDFHTVFSPERVYSGRVFSDLATYPKLVGGLSTEGEARGVELYGAFLDAEVWPMGSAEAAELTKLAETTYRDVNIAFANELAAVCRHLGVDAFETIRLANLHPRVNVHAPGIGVGGHCIPVDPWFLIHLAPEQVHLIRAARTINDARPQQVASDILAAHGPGNIRPIGILGVSYKADVDDVRESPALEVIHELRRTHRELYVYDPFCPEHSNADLDTVLAQDTVAVLQDHRAFRDVTGPRILRWNRA